MKKAIIMLAAVCAICSCGENKSKQVKGFIVDATMNTIMVKSSSRDTVYVFSTSTADKTQAFGLLYGNTVTVDYVGEIKPVTVAKKIATDPTYAKAVGDWTIEDPIAPGQRMGVKIMVVGKAESIRMETLEFVGWDVVGENKVSLYGNSWGKEYSTFTNIGTISEKDGKLFMAIEGTEIVYEKTMP